MKNVSVPARTESGTVSLQLLSVNGKSVRASRTLVINRSARNTVIDPDDYQFICRDMYGVRFFLNERVHRGQGCFLTGRWVDKKGVHAVCGIFHEKTRTVSLFLSGKKTGTVMSHYTYLGDNYFAGVECNDLRDSLYEMNLYMEKGFFPGLQVPVTPCPGIPESNPAVNRLMTVTW